MNPFLSVVLLATDHLSLCHSEYYDTVQEPEDVINSLICLKSKLTKEGILLWSLTAYVAFGSVLYK